MKFEDYAIAPEIKKSLAESGFRRPTDIQYRSIPAILKGEDVLAIAPTGTGKTAAFAIPILHLLQQRTRRNADYEIRCLVMVPTRELAVQITEVFQLLGKHTNLEIFCLHGGIEQDPQIEQFRDGVDVLIATPGRMFDLVSQGHIDLSRVEILVLDEADHMLDLGFIRDIQQVIKLIPRKHQTLFFSATIDKDIKDLAYSVVNNAIRIHVSPKDPVSKNVSHSVAFVEMDDKRHFLERIVKENEGSKMLIFVRTQVRAERVHNAMKRVGIESMTMHGGKEQDDRLEVMAAFKSGKTGMLIATDVSARGIDIPNVDIVINYDLPDVPENYVHRVGRTGRGVQKGTAVSFCSAEEKEYLDDIENYMDKKINVLQITRGEYQETLDLSTDDSKDWRNLLKQAEQEENTRPVKKKKKR